jgi:Thiamine monophosphate synthase
VSIVGRSCHSVDDVRVAAAQNADYVVLGPVFSARSKVSPAAISVSELVEAAASGVPVFAVGGVSMENLEQLRGVPIAGVAAITMFMKDEPLDSILEAVRKL